MSKAKGYWGIFFNPSPIKTSLSGFNDIKSPHVTFEYGDLAPDELVGKKTSVKVVGYGHDDKNEGYLVEIPEDLKPYYKGAENSHITIAVAEGGKPVDTAKLNFKPLPEEKQFVLNGTVESFAFDKFHKKEKSTEKKSWREYGPRYEDRTEPFGLQVRFQGSLMGVELSVTPDKKNEGIFITKDFGNKLDNVSKERLLMPKYCAFVNTYAPGVKQLIADQKLGEPVLENGVPLVLSKDGQDFPLYQFDETRLRELDSEGCDIYERGYEIGFRQEVAKMDLHKFEDAELSDSSITELEVE